MYARLISATSIDRNPPRQAVIDGRFVTGELPEPYLNSQRWYRLETTPAPETQYGYHAEPRYAYDNAENPTKIVQSWVEVEDQPPAPRVFSKLKIVSALMQAGVWEAAKSYIEASGLYDLYLAAQTFREDNPYFAQDLAALKQQLGVTDAEAEAILEASVAD